jgi:NarL family two-component system response regulator LiaR
MHPLHGPRVRVLLVDDHADIRKAVQHILNSYPDIEVVGEAKDGSEAICYAESLRPDVVVMDISMPILDGIKATKSIKAHSPHMVVIGLSVETRKSSITDMLNAGASTVLRKETASDELHSAIHAYAQSHPRHQAGDQMEPSIIAPTLPKSN